MPVTSSAVVCLTDTSWGTCTRGTPRIDAAALLLAGRRSPGLARPVMGLAPQGHKTPQGHLTFHSNAV